MKFYRFVVGRESEAHPAFSSLNPFDFLLNGGKTNLQLIQKECL